MSITTELVGSLTGPISDLLGKFIKDKDQAAQLAHEIATLSGKQAHEKMIAQLKVNEAEANRGNTFIAGWRPFVGWVCGSAMACNYIAFPLLGSVGLTIAPLNLTIMLPVLLGMLGLGTQLKVSEKRRSTQTQKGNR